MTLLESTNLILSVLTVLANFFAVVLIVALVSRGSRFSQNVLSYASRNALRIGFLVSLIAMAGSLTYSELIGFVPCEFCWFQRIFMYPQVFLFGLALWKGDRGILPYALVLSVVGSLIAAYHYLLQRGIVENAPCSAIGQSASCSARFVLQFGYITIPMMALSAFLLIALVSALPRFLKP